MKLKKSIIVGNCISSNSFQKFWRTHLNKRFAIAAVVTVALKAEVTSLIPG